MKKRGLSRRAKAVRRLTALIVLSLVLGAAMVLSGAYLLKPEDTLRPVAYELGVEELTLIRKQQIRGWPEGDMTLLVSRTGDYIVMHEVSFSFLTGWLAGAPHVLDVNEPRERHYVQIESFLWDLEGWGLLFGFVPEGEEPPTFRLGFVDYRGEGFRAFEGVAAPVYVTPQPTIPTEGGMIYLEPHFHSMTGDYDPKHIGFDISQQKDGEWGIPYLLSVSTYE